VVGRGEGADAQVEDGTISRRHAVILHEADNYSIEDLGSQNGTWVDGRRVLTARLNHNARILIGRTQFLFLVHRQAAVTGAPTSSRLAGPEKAVPQVRPVVSVISRPKPGLTNSIELAHSLAVALCHQVASLWPFWRRRLAFPSGGATLALMDTSAQAPSPETSSGRDFPRRRLLLPRTGRCSIRAK